MTGRIVMAAPQRLTVQVSRVRRVSMLLVVLVRSSSVMRPPGRVEDWRACCRWRVSRPALSSAGWVHHSPVATVPTPATSNRTCGSPADGFPTTCFQRRARSRTASSSRGEGFESTGAEQGLELSGGCRLRPACPFPLSHPLPHLSVHVLKLLGRVPHTKLGAPPPNDRVALCHDCRQCAPHPSSFRLFPNL